MGSLPGAKTIERMGSSARQGSIWPEIHPRSDLVTNPGELEVHAKAATQTSLVPIQDIPVLPTSVFVDDSDVLSIPLAIRDV